MGIVAGDEGRTAPRDVYLPRHAQGMAHLSYLSPDRQSVLLVEMDQNHAWTPCRVVPADGTSEGLVTGLGLCTFSGGTGKFTQFHASANVSSLDRPNYAWAGTYSFDPRD